MPAGYKSYAAVWEGGAGGIDVTVGGYTSYEAFWLGGASSPNQGVVGGYQSLEAFWIGGASAASATPTPTPIVGGGWSGWTKSLKKYDDDEILFL